MKVLVCFVLMWLELKHCVLIGMVVFTIKFTLNVSFFKATTLSWYTI